MCISPDVTLLIQLFPGGAEKFFPAGRLIACVGRLSMRLGFYSKLNPVIRVKCGGWAGSCFNGPQACSILMERTGQLGFFCRDEYFVAGHAAVTRRRGHQPLALRMCVRDTCPPEMT